MTMRSGNGSSAAAEQIWLDWARFAAVPLNITGTIEDRNLYSILGGLIGGARVVALGEPAHLLAEPLELRNGLLDYLVREKGFTAIAIESGIAESRAVFDYVRGGEGDLDAVLRTGLSWGFDELLQNRALIAWLRAYNQTSRPERQINFYGFDLPGSPGVTDASRGLEAPFEILQECLQLVDLDMAARFAIEARPFVPKLAALRFLDDGRLEGQLLTRDEHDALTALIGRWAVLITREAEVHGQARATSARGWALRVAKSLQQLDQWLRAVAGHDAAHSDASPAVVAQEQRDRAQANNLDWIIDQEGLGGKVLIFAHRHHLGACPAIRISKRAEWPPFAHRVAGNYLRERYGSALVTIGQVAGGDKGALGGLTPPEVPSLDSLFAAAGQGDYVLDMRDRPLGGESLPPLVAEGGSFRTLNPGSGFDLLLHTAQLTPALRARRDDKGPSR